GRQVLLDACKKYRNNNSEIIEKRWEYFGKLAAEGKLTSNDCALMQTPMLWASVGNTMPAIFWVIYFVLSNEEVKKRLTEEVDSVYKSIMDSSVDKTPFPLIPLD
ncbi:MAG: cytochrome P450, partial [bacterium]